MADYLDTARKAIEEQLASLRDEVQRLEAAHAALNGASAGRRKARRPRGSAQAQGATRRRRRRRGSTRADQANELVKANPGITIPELAQQMGIKQNYLYRVLPTLQKDKKVVKRGKGWHPASSS